MDEELKEPTDKQKIEFWEGCGFRKWKGSLYWYPDDTGVERLPKLYGIEALGNLFRYAVPKARKLMPKGWLTGTMQGIFESDEDPALALFWALREVMKNG